MTEKITCPGCGTEELKEATFCSNCNATLHPPPEILKSETVAGTSTVEITDAMKTIHEHIPSSPDAFEQKPQNPLFLFSVAGVIVLLLVLVLIGAVVFGYYFFTSLDVGKRVPDDSAAVPARASAQLKTQTPPLPVITTQSNFIVKADEKDWQVSEIAVDNSQIFNTDVRGTMVLDGIGANIGPSGISLAPERRVFKEFLTGALLMRIRFPDGKTSVVQSAALSKAWETEENERGVIEFLINDNAPEKNKGLFLFSAKLDKK